MSERLSGTAGSMLPTPNPISSNSPVWARRLEVILVLLALVCVAPTLVRTGPPAQINWDEAYILGRAVCVSRALREHDWHALHDCYALVKKSPVLTFLALPWGEAATSVSGLGLIAVSLRLLEWSLVVAAIALLRWLRVSPLLCLVAGAVVGLTPLLRADAGRVMPDTSFSWVVLLTLLLPPLEAAPRSNLGWAADLRRGALWGTLLALGLGEKLTFGLFAAIVGPVLLVLRWRAQGTRSSLRTAACAAVTAAPILALNVRYWKQFLHHAEVSSFFAYAKLANPGLSASQYLERLVRDTPFFGVSVCFGVVALAVALHRRRLMALASLPGLTALLIYAALTLASPNHEPRYIMPVFVSLPFLLIVPWARSQETRGDAVPVAPALLAAGVLLVSVHSLATLDFTNISDQVLLTRRLPSNCHVLLLGTDSPDLNIDSLQLALELVPEKKPSVGIDTVVYDEADGRDLAFSRKKIARAQYMVVQSDLSKLSPEWTNHRSETFRGIAREQGDLVPELGSRDFEVYALRGPQSVEAP